MQRLFLDVAGRLLHYRRLGAGPPLVLAATLDDPLEPRCVPAAALAPSSDVRTLPTDPRDWPDGLW